MMAVKIKAPTSRIRMKPGEPAAKNRVAEISRATVRTTPVVQDGSRPAVSLTGFRVGVAVVISWLPRTLCAG